MPAATQLTEAQENDILYLAKQGWATPEIASLISMGEEFPVTTDIVWDVLRNEIKR